MGLRIVTAGNLPRLVFTAHSIPTAMAATCDYGGPVTAAVERGTLWAAQFHPEKSAANGLRLLRAFVDRCRTPVPAAT